jgi:hypothetical protein
MTPPSGLAAPKSKFQVFAREYCNEKDSLFGLSGTAYGRIGELSAEPHLLFFEDGNVMNRLSVRTGAISSNRKGLTVG